MIFKLKLTVRSELLRIVMDMNDIKKSYQSRTNIVKGDKGELVTDYHDILTRWRKHFSQLLNVHGINDVRQTEIHTTEPLESEPNAFEVE